MRVLSNYFERKRDRVACLILTISLCLLGTASGEWRQVRGPHRDGTSEETGLVRGWGETGPAEVWRVPLGPGFSSISVAANQVYSMDSDDRSEYVLALEAQTGQEIWRVKVGDLFKDVYGDGPRSTPTVDGDIIYVLSSRGRLIALQTKDGALVWEVDFPETFESELPGWGFSSSPLVFEDQLIVETGGSGARAVSSFDARMGRLNWERQGRQNRLLLTPDRDVQRQASTGFHYQDPIVCPRRSGQRTVVYSLRKTPTESHPSFRCSYIPI